MGVAAGAEADGVMLGVATADVDARGEAGAAPAQAMRIRVSAMVVATRRIEAGTRRPPYGLLP